MNFAKVLAGRQWPALLLLQLVFAALVFSPGRAASVTTEGKTIELPKITVTDSSALPEVESWRYTKITAFEVLSNASDRETKRLLVDFEKFQHAIRLLWPAPLKPVSAATIILCGEKNKFDAFLPAGAKAEDAVVPSLFLRNREQVAILVDVQAQQISINDPAALLATGGSSVEYQVDHYSQLYREYIHYLLSQGEVRPPAWLEEGLAQIIMDIDLRDHWLVYGKVDTFRGSATGGSPLEADANDATVSSAVVGEQPFNVVLQNRPFVPFGQFLAITHDSPEARSPLGNNLWAKQAYAFVHFCLFGEDLRHKEALITFVGRISREPLSEALFKECFKIGYTEMEKQLRAYLRYTKHKYQRYDLQPNDRLTASAIELSPATPAQIGLIKGDALQLAGHTDTALTEYLNAYRRGSREPTLLAGIGAAEANPALARKFTDEAIKAGVDRPSAYITQARIRLADFKADPGPDGKLTSLQVSSVLTPLFKAREFPPRPPEIYEGIAEVWALSSVAPKPEHLAVLDEGVRRYPRNSDLVYRTAALYQQAGAKPTATAIAQVGLRFATDPAAKARFETLLATLPPAGK